MSNDNGTPIPPLPDRSAADAARGDAAPMFPAPQHTAQTQQVATAQEPVYAWASPAHDQGADSRTQKRGGSGGRVAALVVIAALVGGGAGLGGAWLGNSVWGGSNDSSSVASQGQNVTINNPDDVNQTAAIAASALPSVVTIEAATSEGTGGSGSGVVLSEDGYVLTNTHVVTLGGAANDAQLRVTGSDGQIYDATIVGTDPTYDLAVIKLEGASGLTPMEFADSSELNVGDTTVAIGAPMGLANTVTTGIISNLNRSIEIASAAAPEDAEAQEPEGQTPENGGQDLPWFFDIPGQEQQQQQASESIKISVLQTDAAINPGNSGGALVDGEGKLIGINVAIATSGASSEEGGSIGLGFAIPSNVADRIANELIENGSATHGLLGASVSPSAYVEGTTTTGAYVAEVIDGGAAKDGGLQEGDVITHFNGVRVNDAIDLTAQVRAAAAESDATVTYVRDGEEHETELTLGTLE
ncbi:S1C family serine protease [Microbacterium sp. G2-8]|uniref:S1C family serine protease n=1 Tax=Microbacterium sp. G2-8 TaxID=2842454 RepID=UPI001C89875F|nr:trypsin-like peptidase domain-containing protein [Microbacterium sp. G2-8]